MEILIIISVLFGLWITKRIFIGGAKGEKSFVKFASDQNRVRDRIESQGGIRSVERINISELEIFGYYVEETGENFVSLQSDGLSGTSVLKLIHGLNSVTLDLIFFDQSGERLFRAKSSMRSSNNAVREMKETVRGYLSNTNNLDSESRSKIIRHFDVSDSIS